MANTALIAGLRDVIKDKLPASTNKDFLIRSLNYLIYVSKQTTAQDIPINHFCSVVSDLIGTSASKLARMNLLFLATKFIEIEHTCVDHGLYALDELYPTDIVI